VYKPNTGWSGSDSFTYKVSDGTAESSSATVSLTVTNPLMALGGENEDATPSRTLTARQLKPILKAAINRWAAAGVDEAGLAELRNVPVEIVDLPDGYLGGANVDVLMLDVNGAGYGWYIDQRPGNDREFRDGARGKAAHHMDLLTVVMHELGHVLGLPDLDLEENPDNVMAEALVVGIRRQPGDTSFDPALLSAASPDLRVGSSSTEDSALAISVLEQEPRLSHLSPRQATTAATNRASPPLGDTFVTPPSQEIQARDILFGDLQDEGELTDVDRLFTILGGSQTKAGERVALDAPWLAD
jgi:hypothetical protein